MIATAAIIEGGWQAFAILFLTMSLSILSMRGRNR